MYTIKHRKQVYLGHVMRNQDQLLLSIMKRKVKGKRGPGRRILWLRNLQSWFGKTSAECFELLQTPKWTEEGRNWHHIVQDQKIWRNLEKIFRLELDF